MPARRLALLLVVAVAPLAAAQTLMVPADGVTLASRDKASKKEFEREEEEARKEAVKKKLPVPPRRKYEYAKYDAAKYAKYDDTRVYPASPDDPLPPVWVAQGGLEYRAEPGETAAALRGKSALMEPRNAWAVATANGVEYVLVSEIDGNSHKPRGWVRKDQVIFDELTALKVPDKETGEPTAIHRKAMIVNSRRSVEEFGKNAKVELFKLPAAAATAFAAGKLPAAAWAAFDTLGVKAADDPKAEVRPREDKTGWAVSFLARGRSPAAPADDRHYYDVLKDGTGDGYVVREGLNMAWAHDRPQVDRRFRTRSFAVASPLFIYQYQTVDKREFALVGSSPRLSLDAATEIHGWLEVSRLAQWNTAEVIEWDRDSTLPPAAKRSPDGALFLQAIAGSLSVIEPAAKRSPDGALFCGVWDEAAQAEVPDGEKVAKEFWDRKAKVVGETDLVKLRVVDDYLTKHFLAREQTDPVGDNRPPVSRALRGQEMRFPLLEPGDDYEKDGRKTRLYKLGWMGPLIAVGQKDIDPAAFAKIVEDLMRVRGDFQTIELVFVIDGTGGNTELRQAVAPKVVEAWLDGLAKAQAVVPGLRVRASAVLFGVKKDGSLDLAETDKGETEVLAPAPGRTPAVVKRAADRRDKLMTLLNRNDMLKEVNSVEEPVFDAIQHAIGRTDFLPQSQKFVVYIGDMGDVSQGTPEAAIKGLVESLQGREKAIDRGGRQPINFMAVHLRMKGGNAAGERHLTDQLKELKRYAEGVVPKSVGGAEVKLPRLDGATVSVFEASDANGSAVDAVTAQLNGVLGHIRTVSQQVDDEARRLIDGTLRQPESEALKRFFRYNPNVDLSFLRNGYVQVYQVGYAFQDALLPDGRQVPQLKPVYLVPKADVKKLRDFMKELTKEADVRDQDGVALQKALTGAMAAVSGQKDLTPADWGKTLAGIEFKSALLKRDPSEAKQLRVSPEEMNRLYEVALRLDDLVEREQERDWAVTVKTVQQKGVRTAVAGKEVRKVDRVYKFPGDSTEWVWLDKEKHIP